MSNYSASFYISELSKWQLEIQSHFDEIHKIELTLTAIINRNSITDIAAKVGVYQLILNKVKNSFLHVEAQISDLIIEIKSIADTNKKNSLAEKTLDDIKMISAEFKKAENEYDDTRYFCRTFINETLG